MLSSDNSNFYRELYAESEGDDLLLLVRVFEKLADSHYPFKHLAALESALDLMEPPLRARALQERLAFAEKTHIVDGPRLADAAWRAETARYRELIGRATFSSSQRMERCMERVAAGIRRAEARGVHCGRPRVELDLRPAVAMLEKGYGLGVTAKALGVARSTLRRRLEEGGEWPFIPHPRPKGRPRKEIDLGAAKTMLDEGKSLQVTAKALGVARGTLKRRLDEAVERDISDNKDSCP